MQTFLQKMWKYFWDIAMLGSFDMESRLTPVLSIFCMCICTFVSSLSFYYLCLLLKNHFKKSVMYIMFSPVRL
jgi:hypothetical protein